MLKSRKRERKREKRKKIPWENLLLRVWKSSLLNELISKIILHRKSDVSSQRQTSAEPEQHSGVCERQIKRRDWWKVVFSSDKYDNDTFSWWNLWWNMMEWIAFSQRVWDWCMSVGNYYHRKVEEDFRVGIICEQLVFISERNFLLEIENIPRLQSATVDFHDASIALLWSLALWLYGSMHKWYGKHCRVFQRNYPTWSVFLVFPEYFRGV